MQCYVFTPVPCVCVYSKICVLQDSPVKNSWLTKVQHVHVIVADRSVPSAKYIDLPLLHDTRRVTERETKREDETGRKQSD